MGKSTENVLISKLLIVFFITTLHLSTINAATPSLKRKVIEFTEFENGRDDDFLIFAGQNTSIDSGALQLTPDTINDAFVNVHYNKSGKIMYRQPFRVWTQSETDPSDVVVASFNSTFVINLFRNRDWESGNGLAFLISPNASLPEASHGQWLGLTNASTDGNPGNQIVAVEFDTVKQDFDPDDNHMGLNVNSVISRRNVSLNDYNMTLSTNTETSYKIWVEYNGSSKIIQIYMAVDVGADGPKPPNPILTETLNLRNILKEESYFGFVASTGFPEIQLNCVRSWRLEIEDLPEKKDLRWITIIAGVLVPIVSFSLLICAIVYMKRRRRQRKLDEESAALDFGEKLKWLPGMPKEFKYKELKKATNKFHESMKLGEGGFGIVYKGVLPDMNGDNTNMEVAVKQFSRDSIKSKVDFMAELAIIHILRHKHLVRLVGWCYEKGKLLLVYDFMPNGSVEKHLYGDAHSTLKWDRRYKILSGIASALYYLQNEYDQKVVHRDLKPSNILLDEDFNAKLGDFGLARAIQNERNSYTEIGLGGVPGTMGYVAPECFHTGKATPESDIYGFGAVILEIVCGRCPAVLITHEQYSLTLIDWVWMLHREGRIQDAVDPRLGNDFEIDEAKRVLLLGLACSHPIVSERPQTQDILQIISGASPPPQIPPFKPAFTWPSTPAISFTDSLFSSGTNSTLGSNATSTVYKSPKASDHLLI